jgi:uncharacterized protein
MISQKVKNKILNILKTIEKENNICIFYACESGSRAWGFPSTDSDYDIRFLYIHSVEWYLSIDKKRDVIEKPITDEIDITGWDMIKSLQLFKKSNPALLEWLRSPIVYSEKHHVAQKLRELLPEYYSPVACLYHYLHMAQGNYREYLKGDTVWIKKYFYILRPILACLWIEKKLGPVPVEFEVLVNRLVKNNKLTQEIDKLLDKKKKGEELSWGPQIPVINDFIFNQLNRLETLKLEYGKQKTNNELLNKLFRESLKAVWDELAL